MFLKDVVDCIGILLFALGCVVLADQAMQWLGGPESRADREVKH